MPDLVDRSTTSTSVLSEDGDWLASVQPGAEEVSAPSQVTWQITNLYNWKRGMSRATTRALQQTPAFSSAEALHLVDDIARMHVPLLAITGGDPLLRNDLFPILQFASRRMVRTSLTLAPTPIIDRQVIQDLKSAGLMRVVVWLYGSTPASNDAFWRVSGAYRRTLDMIGHCHEVRLPVQVNTEVSRRNWNDLDPMIELLVKLDISSWNVFCFVPANPTQAADLPDAAQHEELFARLYTAAQRVNFAIKTTEGPHFQRYVLQQRARESRGRLKEDDVIAEAAGARRTDGSVFISTQGELYSSRSLPLSAGNVISQGLPDVLRNSPLLASLRDRSKLKGKCGRCLYRNVCGGSRARAYAVTGDVFAPDPACAYQA